MKCISLCISIHAPREGGDLLVRLFSSLILLFQSTPPARGATNLLQLLLIHRINFNPRPPRGGRLNQLKLFNNKFLISIHAPREGGDRSYCPHRGNISP